jgi:hypothetical protein
MQNFTPKFFDLVDVEINYAKLTKPVDPWNTGQFQYEMQAATTDATKADEWRANHLNVKSEVNKETKQPTGKFIVSLKRKATKANGEDNGAPQVVDAAAQPIDASTLGNGSRGNVKVYQMAYSVAGREGIANSLTAIQVTKFEEYLGGAMFEPIVSVEPAAQAKAEAPADTLATADPF